MAERPSSLGATPGTSAGFTAAPEQTDGIVPWRSAPTVTPRASQRFAAATAQLEGGTRVVSFLGDVDLATARGFEQTLLGVAEERTGAVIVDLTGCNSLDGRGLRALIATRARLKRFNRPLALVVSNAGVLRIFQITHFDKLFDIHPSVGAAVDRNGNRNGHG